MKKLFFSIFVLCMGMCAMAQSSIYVCEKGGKFTEYLIENLDSISFKKPTIGTENGYTWVDLGLSVRWATMNVGATNPEDYGNYYAWGEITTKTTYNWSNYKYGSYNTLTKYCNDAKYGNESFTDELTTLKAADDAATQKWGGNWRIPTIDEWNELLKNCDWKWTNNYNSTGMAGYIVSSKTNDNSIFLPAADYIDGSELSKAGSRGEYWSSSLSTSYPGYARILFFLDSDYQSSFSYRYAGLPIRPVSKEGEVIAPCYSVSIAEIENGTVSVNSTLAQAGETVTLKITPNTGYKLKSLSVVCGEKEVEVTNNTFVMPAGEVKITASFVALSFSVSAEKKVKFAHGNLQYTQSTSTWSIAENQYDLIGSANMMNIFKLADKIDLFGWSGSSASAKWGISTSKDCEEYSGDFVDWGKNIDDGNTWRTLTNDEWEYLLNTRTNASERKGIVRINLNDDGSQYVNGLILLPDSWTDVGDVTIKCGFASEDSEQAYADYQTITLADWQKLEVAGAVFLPTAGFRSNVSVGSVQVDGDYWSASAVTNSDLKVYELRFGSNEASLLNIDRIYGCSVRLVQDVE